MLRGSMVALVTPMAEDESVDWKALDALVEWHIAQGTHAIVAMGTTGESATFDMSEHIEVIRKVVEKVDGRLPVIAGTGANSTSEALELTSKSKDVGADACLLVTPYYNKPTQEGLFLHYKYIAERVDIPQLLYNVPGRTAVDLLPETIGRLAKFENIIGIKEATGDIDRVAKIRQCTSESFILISCDDETAVDFMAAGGCGEISVTANVAPAKVAKMCELVLEGDVEGARDIDKELLPLHQAMFLESNPIPVKYAVAYLGFMQNILRLPLTPLSPEYHDQLHRAMAHNQLL